LQKCKHFEWIDEYVERLQVEGAIVATEVPNPLNLAPPVVEPVGDSSEIAGQRAVRPNPMMGNAELMAELIKVNKNLKKMIELKKSANLMAAGFYCCIIAFVFFYLFFCR
jgi:hypothetical protein